MAKGAPNHSIIHGSRWTWRGWPKQWAGQSNGRGVRSQGDRGGLPNPWPNMKEAEVMEDKEAMALNNRSCSVDTT